MSNKNKQLRLAVLMGGISSEHDVSINSGINVSNTLSAKHLVKPVIITRSGGWRIDKGWLDADDTFEEIAEGVLPVDAGSALQLLKEYKIDLAFIALHGPGGEDGVIQGFLETSGITYTGSGVLTNALCMDKILSKQLMIHNNILTPDYIVATNNDLTKRQESIIGQIEEALGYPCVVKVNNQGSSHNVGIAKNVDGLRSLFERFKGAGDLYLIEEFISGRELTCAVINKSGEENPLALPPTELILVDSEFFDYKAKYTPGATKEITPAKISKEITSLVQEAALRCHTLFRCGGMSRTDMILHDDQIWVLEINTIPGLTTTSLIPQAAAAAGIEFPELLEILIQWALDAGQEK